MKKFKINSKLVFDVVMGIIMIPFVLISAVIVSFATIFHFGVWWCIRIMKK
jgi:hypothetical protein